MSKLGARRDGARHAHPAAALAAILATPVFPLIAAQPQQVVPMPRDRTPVTREGTAVVIGRVVDGVTGTAVPRARVRLMGPAGPRPLVLTDENGQFRFTKLPSGSYSLSVEKPTYMRTQYPGMGATVRSRMRPLAVREGEPPQALTIPLFRGGAISGRIVDTHGDPVEHAQIQVMRVAASRGGGRDMRGSTQTNDLGEFRIGRLEAGSYILLAVAERMGPDDTTPTETAPSQPVPTYYPGALSIDQAVPITLDRGQQAAGIELVLAEGTPTIVTGTILSAEGTPVTSGAFVSARLVGSTLGGLHAAGAGLRPDGTFRMQLAPGDYVLDAHVAPGGPARHRSAPEAFGSVRLSVGQSPIESVTIVVGSGAIATGRVVFEGTAPLPAIPKGLHLPLRGEDGGLCRAGEVQVNADWTFRVDGLIGTCMAPGWEATFGRWTLKNVLINAEDVLRKKITFQPGQRLRNVQVTFTDRRTSMAFAVTDETGERTRDYVALVFPSDKSLWTPTGFVRVYAPPTTLPMASVTPTDFPPGVASVPQLPPRRPEVLPMLTPGDYYVIAVDDIAHDQIQDPDVADRLVPHAMRVSVPEGSITEVSLRRVKYWQGQ